MLIYDKEFKNVSDLNKHNISYFHTSDTFDP